MTKGKLKKKKRKKRIKGTGKIYKMDVEEEVKQ